MKAEKMFIAINHIPKREGKNLIYKNPESGSTIIFDKVLKMVIFNTYVMTPKMINAVHEQMKELEWIDG